MYLQSNGATVDLTEDPDRALFRASMGIPDSAASCHTAVIDGYAIEGHVPAEAIRRLVTDRPTPPGWHCRACLPTLQEWGATQRRGWPNR